MIGLLAIVAAVAVIGFFLGSFFGPPIITTIEADVTAAVKAARALIAAEEARAVALLQAKQVVSTAPQTVVTYSSTGTTVVTPNSTGPSGTPTSIASETHGTHPAE